MKKLILITLMVVFTTVWTLSVCAEVADQIEQQKSSVDSALTKNAQQKQQLQNDKTKLQSDQKYVSTLQAQKDAEFQKLLAQQKLEDDAIKEYENSIKDSENKYNNQNEILKKRLKTLYENSNNSYMQTLIESKNLLDFLDRVELISLIAKKDKEILENVKTAKLDFEYKKSLKVADKLVVTQNAIAKQTDLQALAASRSSIEQQVKSKENSIKILEQQEDQLYKQSQELAARLKSLRSSGGKYAGGTMVWPNPSTGSISSPFGYRIHPIFKTYKMHTGIDINAAYGTTTVAANDGTVIVAGWEEGYGNTIVIDHGGGITTLYGHSSTLLVSKGAYVKAGTPIAKVGSTGNSTGPHLHFEVSVNGEWVDPLQYVSY